MLTGTVRGQALDGVFEADSKRGLVLFTSESFRFSGARFAYRYGSCTENAHGHGTYTLQDGVLNLQFEALSPPGSVQAMPCATNALTPRFCFAVTDAATQQPERHLQIRSKNQPASTFTNDNGEAVLAYSPLPGDSIVVGDPGYFGCTVAITDAKSQGYRIALAERDIIRPGTVYSYYVTRQGPKHLLIRRFDSKEERPYRRMTARELKKGPW